MSIFSQYKGLRKEQYVIFISKLIDNLGSMIGPLLTIILSIKLGMNASEIALYSLVITVLSLPISLFGGRLTDKINKKLLINIGDITTSILYIICGIVGLNRTTLVIYIIGSLIQTAESPAYESLIADFTTSEDRERAYSLNYLGTNLGLMLAPTIGGLLINNHLNLMFILTGSSQLLSIIIFDIFIKDTRPIIDTSNKYENKLDKGNVFDILKKNKVLIAYMIIFAVSITTYCMWGYLLPLSLTKVQGELGSIYYGTMSSLNCIVVVLCTAPITSLISRTISINRMIIGNILEVLGFTIFFIFIKIPTFYYLAIIIFTFGEIVNTITTSPHLSKRIPINYRGRISSMLYVIENIFISVGEIIIGRVFDNVGLNIAWIIVIIVGVLSIFAYQFTKKKDKETFPDLYKEKVE